MSDIGEESRTWQLEQTIASLQARIELLEHDAKTGDFETLYAQAVCELQAAHAREERMRKAIGRIQYVEPSVLAREINQIMDMPRDNTELRARLKAERERVAFEFGQSGQLVTSDRIYVVNFIRNLGDE